MNESQGYRDNSGRIKRNARKTESKHADFKGAATVGGVEYWISAWVSDDNQREPSIGLRFERKDDQPQGAGDRPPPTDRAGSMMTRTPTGGGQPVAPRDEYADRSPPAESPPFDDDIPF